MAKVVNKTGIWAAGQELELSPSINTAAGGGLHVGTEAAGLTATEEFKAGGTKFGVK